MAITRLWTGPVYVKELAEKMREAGINVVIEGTEHLYVEADDRYSVAQILLKKHGTAFGF